MPRFLVDIAVIVEATDHIEARNAMIRSIGAQIYVAPSRVEQFGEVKVSPLAPLLDHAFVYGPEGHGHRCKSIKDDDTLCGVHRAFHR